MVNLRFPAVLLVAVAVVAVGCGQDEKAPEPPAVAVADSIAAAYGGTQALLNVSYLRFDLAVRRRGQVEGRFRHLWNMKTGDVRYEADLTEFSRLSFLGENDLWEPQTLGLPPGRLHAWLNRGTGEGDIRIESEEPISAPMRDRLLDLVRQRVEHDGFWLLLPLRLHEPGVTAQWVGESFLESGRRTQETALSFAPGTGATPGDRHRLYCDPRSWALIGCRLRPQGTETSLYVAWSQPVSVGGGLRLSPQREFPDHIIAYDLLAVPRSVQEEVFRNLTLPIPY